MKEKFIIKSTDIHGLKEFEIVKGNLELNSSEIKYFYESKLGKCMIKYNGNKINIIRNGENESRLEIEIGKKLKMFHSHQYIGNNLYTLGKEISIDENTKDINFVYSIMDDIGNIMNEISVHIKKYSSI